MTSQDAKREMQPIDGLLIKRRTLSWMLWHRLSMNVKHALQLNKPSS